MLLCHIAKYRSISWIKYSFFCLLQIQMLSLLVTGFQSKSEWEGKMQKRIVSLCIPFPRELGLNVEIVMRGIENVPPKFSSEE